MKSQKKGKKPKKTNKNKNLFVDLFIADNKFRIKSVRSTWITESKSGEKRSYSRKYRDGYLSKFYKPLDGNITKAKDIGDCLVRDILLQAGEKLNPKVDRQEKFKNKMTVLSQMLFNLVVPILLVQDREVYSKASRRDLAAIEGRIRMHHRSWPEKIGDKTIKEVALIIEALGLATINSSPEAIWKHKGHSLPSLIQPTEALQQRLIDLGVIVPSPNVGVYTTQGEKEEKSRNRASSIRLTETAAAPSHSSPLRSLSKTGGPISGFFTLSPAFMRVCERMDWHGDVVQRPTFYTRMGPEEIPVELEALPSDMREVAEEIIQSNVHMSTTPVFYSNGSKLSSFDSQLRVKVAEISDEDISWNFGRTSCSFVSMDKGQKANLFFGQVSEETRATEVDLSSLYPTLFKAETGIDLEGSYKSLTAFLMAHPSWDHKLDFKATRGVSKRIVNAIIVSGDQDSAEQAIRQQVNFSTIADEDAEVYRISAEEVLYFMYKSHPSLRKEAFSRAWIEVMTSHETRLMSRIRQELASVAVPFLSCYDAVWVPKIAEEDAINIMDNQYKTYLSEIK